MQSLDTSITTFLRVLARGRRARPASRAGQPYRRLDRLPPRHPVVPADAPAALRIPAR